MSTLRFHCLVLVGSLLVSASNSGAAQEKPAAPRDLPKLVTQLCASCHGPNLEGGSAPSLIDAVWKYGDSDDRIATSIRVGYPLAGMPSFDAALSEKEVQGMVIYLKELAGKAALRSAPPPRPKADAVNSTQLHSYRMETVATDLKEPWALAFLPDGSSVVTEKRGTLRVVVDGVTGPPVTGTPTVDTEGQAGLFDVVPHPDFARNGWIYLVFADPQKNAEGFAVSMTAVVRGRIKANAWTDQEVIFSAPLAMYRKAGGVHFGGRLTFDRDGFLFFSIGERGNQVDAQNLSVPNGKIHRVHDDGRVPEDNPFVNKPGAMPSIWSYGHRNPQGLRFDPSSGLLWEHEHGPRGGDELNLVQRGRNYGWPIASYGINYNGTPLSEITTSPDFEPPVTYWIPSIAPCGLSIYSGSSFPKWRNHLFIASLAGQELRRIEVQNGKIMDQEIIFKGLGRMRDVTSGPDGLLYVLFPDRVDRLVPASP